MGKTRFTAKVKAFIAAYEGNVADAAASAGVSVRHAYRILKNPAIIEKIKETQGSEFGYLSENIADRNERLEFLTAVVRGDHTDIRVDKDGCKTEVPASLKTRLKALELLGKAHCDYSDKIIHEGGEKPIEHRVNSQDLKDRIQNLVESEPEFSFLE